MNNKLTGSLLSATIALALAIPAFAQTTLDGVYSNAQAQRGSRVYNNICAHCHEGGEPDADPLIGPDFVERWREAPLAFLHSFFSNEMPADEPGTLKPAEYLDVLAFLLKENGFPAGTAELTEEKLNAILFVGENGPQPLPANSLVRVVGCLAPEGDEWSLTAASEPARVRTADETDAEELAASDALPAGGALYKLRNAGNFAAGDKATQRVQIKGVFYTGSPPTLSVLSLESTGSSCE